MVNTTQTTYVFSPMLHTIVLVQRFCVVLQAFFLLGMRQVLAGLDRGLQVFEDSSIRKRRKRVIIDGKWDSSAILSGCIARTWLAPSSEKEHYRQKEHQTSPSKLYKQTLHAMLCLLPFAFSACPLQLDDAQKTKALAAAGRLDSRADRLHRFYT